jgi:hypothetical protein
MMASDVQGAGRGWHELDSTVLLEIHRIGELGCKGVLIRFVDSKRNNRWVPLEDLDCELQRIGFRLLGRALRIQENLGSLSQRLMFPFGRAYQF